MSPPENPYSTARREGVDGSTTLGDRPWDPIRELLPQRELLSVQLDSPIYLGRDIILEGNLDPEAFWPYADTIGGSRWPGMRGGPRR